MKCPFCAEVIQDAAIKCKHCGEFLDKNNPRIQHSLLSNSSKLVISEEDKLRNKLTSNTIPFGILDQSTKHELKKSWNGKQGAESNIGLAYTRDGNGFQFRADTPLWKSTLVYRLLDEKSRASSKTEAKKFVSTDNTHTICGTTGFLLLIIHWLALYNGADSHSGDILRAFRHSNIAYGIGSFIGASLLSLIALLLGVKIRDRTSGILLMGLSGITAIITLVTM